MGQAQCQSLSMNYFSGPVSQYYFYAHFTSEICRELMESQDHTPKKHQSWNSSPLPSDFTPQTLGP